MDISDKLTNLKNQLLDLAIRGKLVEQRPEEGTAEELYAQIQEEKNKLIAEGKIKKEKPLPEITDDEIPFEIPESWKWVRIGNIISIARGASPRPIKAFITEDTNGINWIKIGDTTEGDKYINSSKEKITQEGSLKSRVVHSGDFLLTNSMSFGHPYILNIDGCVHDGWLILSDYSSCYDKLFLYYLLSSSFAYIQFSEAASGTTVKNLNSDKVSSSIFPLPPLAEQKRIVDKLMSFLAVIDKAEELIEKKANIDEEIRNKILDLAIRGKLVEQRPEEGTAEELYAQIQEEKKKLIAEGKIKKEKPLPEITDDEMPFDIPESWNWVRLSQLVNIQNGDRGKNYPSKETLHKVGIPFISAINLDGKSVCNDERLMCLDDNQYNNLRAGKLQKNDLVVCIRGSLGKHGKYPFEKGAIASSLVIVRQYSSEADLTDYLSYYLDSSLFFKEIKKYDNGTAQPNLAAKDLEKFLIPLPPLAEQKRIVAKIEELLPYCDKLK
jgi:type I restriction enzyme S subunit